MPTLGAPLNDVLNSLTRFVIALCVVVSIYRQTWAWLLYLGLPALVLLVLAHRVIGDDTGSLGQTDPELSLTDPYVDDDADTLARPRTTGVPIRRLFPTHHNPYANPDPTNLNDGTMVLPPKNPDSARIRSAIRATGADEIVRDERDMFNRNEAGGLQWNTVAGTPYGDPLGEFRSFLAKDMLDTPSRKEMHSNFGPISVYRDLRNVPRQAPYPYLPDN